MNSCPIAPADENSKISWRTFGYDLMNAMAAVNSFPELFEVPKNEEMVVGMGACNTARVMIVAKAFIININ